MNRPAPLIEFIRDLVRTYEERHEVTLQPDEIAARFGEDRARVLNGLLVGRLPARSSDVIQVVETLEGSDEDIGTALQFCPAELREDGSAEDAMVLNTRLVQRAIDLENFLRSIGQYEAFRAWHRGQDQDS
jgi:hypothetical protein